MKNNKEGVMYSSKSRSSRYDTYDEYDEDFRDLPVFLFYSFCGFFTFVLMIEVATSFNSSSQVHFYNEFEFPRYSNLSQTIASTKCDYMDVVFSWADGSDPEYIKSWEKAAGRKMDSTGKIRSQDHGTLRFAIRSVVDNIPFMRNLILVTNNQVPKWINTTVPNLRIVSIDEMFKNKSHVPSFNSNGIEANLQYIPGLSECFLYLCDDYFISKKLDMSDFISEDGRQIMFMSYDHAAPFSHSRNARSIPWHNSITYSNDYINKHYHPNHPGTRHYYADHIVYFFRKSALEYMHQIWGPELDDTSSQKFRSEHNMVISFLHHNVILEENIGIPKFNLGKTIRWRNSHAKNTIMWDKLGDKYTSFCIQDEFNYDGDYEEIVNETKYLTELLCGRFPYQSYFELSYDNPCKMFEQELLIGRVNKSK